MNNIERVIKGHPNWPNNEQFVFVVIPATWIRCFDIALNVFQTNHVIGWNRSRDLFQPIVWFVWYLKQRFGTKPLFGLFDITLFGLWIGWFGKLLRLLWYQQQNTAFLRHRVDAPLDATTRKFTCEILDNISNILDDIFSR